MPQDGPLYVERLAVRPLWWLVAILVAVLGAAELAAGFDWRIALIALGAALAPTLSVLLVLGRLTVCVDRHGLTAGGRTMNYDDMESVEVLDREQTRLRMGPQADPSAFHVFRGYIQQSVLVRPLVAHPVPYWLVSSRRPQAIVAAVEHGARTAFSDR